MDISGNDTVCCLGRDAERRLARDPISTLGATQFVIWIVSKQHSEIGTTEWFLARQSGTRLVGILAYANPQIAS